MYYCVIRDMVTCDVLGDYMAKRMTKELALNAIMAMLARHKLLKECIFHSDRGSQYTSKAVMWFAEDIWSASELLASRNAGRQCMIGKLLRDHEKELIHWMHYETKEAVPGLCLSTSIVFARDQNPETDRLHVAEGISQISANRPDS